MNMSRTTLRGLVTTVLGTLVLGLGSAPADAACDPATSITTDPREVSGPATFDPCLTGRVPDLAMLDLRRTSPAKLAESAAEIATLRADIEARQFGVRSTYDCPTCLRNEQTEFASEAEPYRGSAIYIEIYDRFHWITDLNPLSLFDGEVSTDGYVHTAWYGEQPFNMDDISMHTDMWFTYLKPALSFWPPGAAVETDDDGWGAAPSNSNAWKLTVTGGSREEGNAITSMGHDASACHRDGDNAPCVRAEYEASLDPTVTP